MIKINLARRKTATIAAAEAEQSGLTATVGGLLSGVLRRSSGAGASASSTTLSDLPIRSILIALIGIYGADFYFESEKAAALQAVEAAIQKERSEQSALQSRLATSKGLEELKRGLEADERLVRTKLEVILKLMQDKQGGVTALRHVSSAIPEEVWLSSLAITSADFNVSGQALDYNQVSDFMNRLNQTDFLADLNLDGSSQSKDEKGLSVATFRLTAKRK